MSVFGTTFERITALNNIQPVGRSEHCMSCSGEYIFIFGGVTTNATILNDLWMINFNKNNLNNKKQKWINLSIGSFNEWPKPLTSARMIYNNINNCLYIFGGFLDNFSEKSNNDLWEFNITKNTMKKIKAKKGCKLPRKRAGHIMCCYNGNIYIHGGTNGKYQGIKEQNIIHMFNVNNYEWKRIIIKNNGGLNRCFHNSVLYNNNWIIHGGFQNNGSWEIINLDNYKSIKLKWKLKLNRHTLWICNQKIIIFGGCDDAHKKKDELIYFDSIKDFVDNKSMSTNVLTPRMSQTGCVVHNNILVLFGGIDFTWLNELYIWKLGSNNNSNGTSKSSIMMHDEDVKNDVDIFKLATQSTSIIEYSDDELMDNNDNIPFSSNNYSNDYMKNIWNSNERSELDNLKNEIELLKQQLNQANQFTQLKTNRCEVLEREKNHIRILSQNMLRQKDNEIDSLKRDLNNTKEVVKQLNDRINNKDRKIYKLTKMIKKSKKSKLSLATSMADLHAKSLKLIDDNDFRQARLNDSCSISVNKLLY